MHKLKNLKFYHLILGSGTANVAIYLYTHAHTHIPPPLVKPFP